MLAGGAAALFGELLGGSYLPARLTRQTDTYAPGGKLQRSSAPGECLAQVDRCTERMVQAEGYTATDRAIYILAASFEGEVDTDGKIEVLEGPYAGAVFRLASPIDRDPACAYWLCRGVEDKHG